MLDNKNAEKINSLITSDNVDAAFEILKSIDDPNIYKKIHNFELIFNNVYRKYHELGDLKLLDGSLKSGYFEGYSIENVSYTFCLNKNNIFILGNILKKIDDINKNKKNIIINYNQLPDYIDEYTDAHEYETYSDSFHSKSGMKIDKKLYYSPNIFNSNRWNGDYTSQEYIDDEVILARSGDDTTWTVV